MDSDGSLKLLFRRYAQDLLPLTGDEGAVVERAGPVEIRSLERRVDCVLELTKAGERYYRHLEFQSRPDPEMAKRCFRYNSQLILQYDAPVLTTVLYLSARRSRREAAFRVMLAGQEINRWTFEEVHLCERDAREALAGAPGLAALVPLMKGGSELALVEQAARRIERAFPGERLSDAEDVLLMLASQYYTGPELARIVGRDRMIQSSLYIEGRAEGRVEGRVEGRAEGQAEGRLQNARQICAAIVRKQHPAIADRLLPAIAACSEPARLKQWAVAAPDLDDAQFLRLLGLSSSTKATQSRGSRGPR